ncbi:Serine/threonine protein kinase [Streptomyces sp. LamerLS-316]|uniref:serine/threonine-protein kinase n=1 Tax=unclassified Streptomyces TaxID=2593676 RepID=UPI000823A393|nr:MULTISPECIES: serine/threonine-protein kinase [unclassified Streptomyces]MYQ42758.1 PQQ-binding-like beta-propeller repeat protein [Streptomyces sp. SID4921]SCK32652.1 Serine/threonine protein kinase [Streptomyces sp. LamerLS-316]
MFFPLTHDDPSRVGGYRPVARLGGGGMGTVYLARAADGRTVALKTMHARLAADPVFRSRFRLETDAARIIGPVHGARVLDADPAADIPWLATEYVLGPGLDQAVSAHGAFPEPTVRALGALLCAALVQLHRSDVVHRDLKPSNIMLTVDGPKVIDFGIARADGDEHLTRAGAAAGTPAFMSPEQATGQEHTASGDVFALAGLLTYAATGHGPFGAGQPADLLYRVRYAEPDLTGVPPALVPVLARALGKDPADRPSAADLAAWLEPPGGGFSEHLPGTVLTDIARRAAVVFAEMPRRTAPDDGEGLPDTVVRTAAGPSRRGVLAAGGASLLALAGTGAWAWHDRQRPGGPGGSTAPRTSAADMLWQVPSDSGSGRDLPSAPLMLEDRILVALESLMPQALDPRTGRSLWSDEDVFLFHQMATDGKRVYAVDYSLEDDAPYVVRAVDPATGKADATVARLTDLRGRLFESQLLCATDTVLLGVGGTGRRSTDGFRKDQTWFLFALDPRTGDRLWTRALPTRPDGAKRLHFLSGRVEGDHLVLVQQAEDGGLSLTVHEARTGTPLWDTPLDGDGPALDRAGVAVDAQHVYLAADGLVARRLADGVVAWHHEGDRPGTVHGPPAVKNGVVHAAVKGQGLVAVRAGSGRTVWAQTGRADMEADAPPTVGTAYVYGESATGLAAADLRTGAVAQPLKAARGRYFVHGPSGRLIARGEAYTAGYPLL